MEITEQVKELKPNTQGYYIQVIYTYHTTNIAEYEQFKNSLGERLNQILVMRTNGEQMTENENMDLWAERFFEGFCPYTGIKCEKWNCSQCEIEEQEQKLFNTEEQSK